MDKFTFISNDLEVEIEKNKNKKNDAARKMIEKYLKSDFINKKIFESICSNDEQKNIICDRLFGQEYDRIEKELNKDKDARKKNIGKEYGVEITYDKSI